MTTYYKKENNEIIKSTPFEKVAKTWGSYQTTEENIVYGYDGKLYLESECPQKPAPTEEEQRQKREQAYTLEVDPITCHISRLADEEQTPEIEQEIAELKQERSAKVEEIKKRYPYPVGEEQSESVGSDQS